MLKEAGVGVYPHPAFWFHPIIGATPIAAPELDVIGCGGLRNVRIDSTGYDYAIIGFDIDTSGGVLAGSVSAYVNGDYQSSTKSNSIVVHSLRNGKNRVNLILEPDGMIGDLGWMFERPWTKDRVRLSWDFDASDANRHFISKYKVFGGSGGGAISTASVWASVTDMRYDHLASAAPTSGTDRGAKADTSGSLLWNYKYILAQAKCVTGGTASNAQFKWKMWGGDLTKIDYRVISTWSTAVDVESYGRNHAFGTSGLSIMWTGGTFATDAVWELYARVATHYGPTSVDDAYWQFAVAGVDAAGHTGTSNGTVGVTIDSVPSAAWNLSAAYYSTSHIQIVGSFSTTQEITYINIYSNCGDYCSTDELRSMPDTRRYHSDHLSLSTQPNAHQIFLYSEGLDTGHFSYISGTLPDGRWRFLVRLEDSHGHEEDNLSYLDVDLISGASVVWPRKPENLSLTPAASRYMTIAFDLHASSDYAAIYATSGVTAAWDTLLATLGHSDNPGWEQLSTSIQMSTSGWWSYAVRGRTSLGYEEPNTDVIASAQADNTAPSALINLAVEATT